MYKHLLLYDIPCCSMDSSLLKCLKSIDFQAGDPRVHAAGMQSSLPWDLFLFLVYMLHDAYMEQTLLVYCVLMQEPFHVECA